MRFPGATHLVICCRGQAEEALAAMRGIMQKLKLTVNETKTRVCKLPGEKFDFLGYTFGRCYSPQTGRAYLGTVPSKKRVIRICKAISSETGRNKTLLDQETVVGKLNRMMTGWANYFCLGPVSKAYRAVEQHARKRLRQWLCAKHKMSWPATGRFPVLLQRFPVLQLGAPGENRVAEVNLIGQHAFRWPDLGGDSPARLENRCVVPPGTGDNVKLSPHGAECRSSGLWGLRWPCHQFTVLPRQFVPTVIEFHVVADLDAESTEITLEDRHFRPQRRTALHGLAIWRNYEVDPSGYPALCESRFQSWPHFNLT